MFWVYLAIGLGYMLLEKHFENKEKERCEEAHKRRILENELYDYRKEKYGEGWYDGEDPEEIKRIVSGKRKA